MTALLGAQYIPISILHGVQLGTPQALPSCIATAATAALLLSLAAWWWVRPPSALVGRIVPRPIALVLLGNVALHYTLAGSPEFATQYLLLLFGGSVLLLEGPVLAAYVAIVLTTWAVTTWAAVPDANWVRDGGFLVGMTFVVAAIYFARVVIMGKVEQLRRAAVAGREAAERGRASAERAAEALRLLVERNPDGVLVLGEERILYANPSFMSLLRHDREAILGTRLGDLCADGEGRLAAWLASDEAGEVEVDAFFSRSDGEVVLLRLSPPRKLRWAGKPAVLVSCRDVTSRNADLQARLMHADRLVAAGTLAAGVAHEVNNPLAWILANARVAQEELDRIAALPAPQRDVLDGALTDIVDGAGRIQRVVADLGGLAGPGATEPIDLHEIVRSAMRLAGNQLHVQCDLACELRPVPAVRGSFARLGQVVWAVLLNAADAVQDSPEKRVTLSTWTSPDGDAVLAVRDTGCGIDSKDLLRVFDPFFTTKAVGRGTGLGLTMSRNIVEEHGGHIAARSDPGRGTVVTVVIPAAVAERAHRVLVVDDEPEMGRAWARLLSPCEVQVCTDGSAGLEAMEQTRFDVVLCDVMMPVVDGPAFHAEVTRRWPGAEERIVFVTGGAFLPHVAEQLDALPNTVLRKPVEPDVLRAAVEGFARVPDTQPATERQKRLA